MESGTFADLRWTPSERNGLLSLVFQCPTPGWQARFDQALADVGTTRVFVTMTRPSPLFVYAQVVTRQEVGTPVPAGSPVEVFVRLADSDQKESDLPPYRASPPQAASSLPAPGQALAPR